MAFLHTLSELQFPFTQPSGLKNHQTCSILFAASPSLPQKRFRRTAPTDEKKTALYGFTFILTKGVCLSALPLPRGIESSKTPTPSSAIRFLSWRAPAFPPRDQASLKKPSLPFGKAKTTRTRPSLRFRPLRLPHTCHESARFHEHPNHQKRLNLLLARV